MQKRILSIFFIGLLSFYFSEFSYSQNTAHYQNKFKNLLRSQESHIHNSPSSHRGILEFYKHYISSQDAGSCPYSPSCSVYAHRSIKEYGIFFGLIKSFDRLSRCNRNQNNHYEHTSQHKLIDNP